MHLGRAGEEVRRKKEKEERERRRPACARCAVKFSDERWAEKEKAWNDDRLCADCRPAGVDRRAREAAEREQAAAEAEAAVEAKRAGVWWRRS
ncbi:hypothetical protein [Kitasatospora sp. NPDC050463]|uniref:hypothetical protein n=1 Tax=Kitasatospora sp. NPDC050463 TaxID=3155786 RepID=UPI0033CBEC50